MAEILLVNPRRRRKAKSSTVDLHRKQLAAVVAEPQSSASAVVGARLPVCQIRVAVGR
jgi:hypothetical protein